MFIIYHDKNLRISFNFEPKVDIRYILPWHSEEEKKDIRKKPFQCENELNVLIEDLKNNREFYFIIPNGYTWDGATIPKAFWRLIGSKTDNAFLIASCIHDFMCENKSCVDYDRSLSSNIFKALLISGGVSKIKAQTMYLAVDNFQRFCGWSKK